MTRNKPPFRADVVGSLLRTAALKEARVKRERARSAQRSSRKSKTARSKKSSKSRRRSGSKSRPTANSGVMVALRLLRHAGRGARSRGGSRLAIPGRADPAQQASRINGKLGFLQSSDAGAFDVSQSPYPRDAEDVYPEPGNSAFPPRAGCLLTKEYADRDAIFDDLAKTYRQAIRAFYDAGCRYLQFDDTAWAYLCSPTELKRARERGLNADHLAKDYARVINQALEGKPADMVVTTHVCRGNFRSTWISEGGYEPIAEIMLGELNYDAYFLEYDSARAGGFEPLRFLPKGKKIVVLGLVTTKSRRAGKQTGRQATHR